MNARKRKLKLLLDEGVPNSVGLKFKEYGHEVHFLNESQIVMRGSPDPLVATAAIANQAILVALDGDMRALAKGYGLGQKRYAKLNLIKISCTEPKAAKRIEAFMSLIEHEWRVINKNGGARLFLEIQDSQVKSIR